MKLICFGLALTLYLTSAIPIRDGDSPTQIHINLGSFKGDAMTITWITQTETDGMVMYGTDSTDLKNKVSQTDKAIQYTYTSKYRPNEPYTSGMIHHVTLTGLTPLTKYYYKCGTESATSTLHEFITPPAVGPSSKLTLGLIGDLGQTVNSSQTLEHIQNDSSIQTTLLVGDLSYADSEGDPRVKPCTQTRWDSWGKLVEPTFSNLPLMTLPGNHEIEQDGPPPATQTQFLAYTSRFYMPAADSGATHGSLYYSIEIGPAHIIMLNSYMDFDTSSDQYKWLVKDLTSVDRSVTPWLIACMHAPWYNSNTAHHNEPEEYLMREAMEGLFHSHGVDVVFAGHVHAYERMHPVYQNETTPGAPTYINIGDGGNREGPASGYYTQPEWSAFRMPIFGHGRLELLNTTHALWSWNRNDQGAAVVSDHVYLVHNNEHVAHNGHGGVSAFPYDHIHRSTF